MDKFLKPERFDSDPNRPHADQEWEHWLTTFENFISSIKNVTANDKLKLLIAHVSHSTYEYINHCDTHENAVQTLKSEFVKQKNEIFARHCLSVRKQQNTESVNQYIQVLKLLSKTCNFKATTAVQNRDEYIRDAFINGLQSQQIRQRLLENNTLKHILRHQTLFVEYRMKNDQAEPRMTNLLPHQLEVDAIFVVIHISLKLARICQLIANLKQAAIGYKWCLDQIDKKKNESVDSKVLYGVINDWYAQFLLDTGETNKAVVHLKEAHRICKEIVGENSEQAVLLLNDLGTTSFRADDMVNAEKYLKEAISMGVKLDDKSHLGVIQANLGLILLEKGIFDLAEKYCNEAWQTGKKYENDESINQAKYCLDQIKMNLKDKAKS